MNPTKEDFEKAREIVKNGPWPTNNGAELFPLPDHDIPKQCLDALINAFAKALAEQREKLSDEIEHLKRQLENQTYNGNSIGYIYDKMRAYSGQVYPMTKALKILGFDYAESGKDNSSREHVLIVWAHQENSRIKNLESEKARLEEVGKELGKKINRLTQHWFEDVTEKVKEIKSIEARLKAQEAVLEGAEIDLRDFDTKNYADGGNAMISNLYREIKALDNHKEN